VQILLKRMLKWAARLPALKMMCHLNKSGGYFE
jgi:hypothetical protein